MKKYSIIYADPPWAFNNKNTGGNMISGAGAHYDTMNIDDICRLGVPNIAADDCILFMWWVASQPEEAIRVAKSWGFKIKTMSGFNWVKTTKHGKLDFGMGFTTRAGSELCLVATKGSPKRANAGVRSVVLAENTDENNAIFAVNEKHSKKPEIFRNEIVKLMGDLPRVELFARQHTEGWDVFGNEVSESIQFKSTTLF